MWFIVVAVLGLLSTGHSAPVTSCETLIEPIEIQGRDEVRSTHFPHTRSFEVVLVQVKATTHQNKITFSGAQCVGALMTLPVSAVGQMDICGRKHQPCGLQIPEDVRGQQLGESHCCERE